MKKLEKDIAEKEPSVFGSITRGRIELTGPLPDDFSELFAEYVVKTCPKFKTPCPAGIDKSKVIVTDMLPVRSEGYHKAGYDARYGKHSNSEDEEDAKFVEIIFEAPRQVVLSVEGEVG